MNRKEIKTNVVNVINSIFQANIDENIDECMMLDSFFNFTSLQVIEFIVAIEEKYGFEVEPENLNVDFFSNIKSICDYIETRVV